MNQFAPRVTKIKDLSDRRRLPRLGSIRLGIKVATKDGKSSYPKEVPYFVCPQEVKKVYGEKPTELEIMLPINDTEAVFPQSYKYYGSSKGLICQGDGEVAYRVNPDTKEMEQRICPCELLEQKKCKQSACLMAMLPKVSVGGVYQIRTSSYNSIVDVNSGLDYVSALLGRFALVPLMLKREKTETHHDEKKQDHYTLKVVCDINIDTLNQLRSDNQRVLEHPRYALPAPLDENPELDPPDVVEDEEEQKQSEPPKEPEPILDAKEAYKDVCAVIPPQEVRAFFAEATGKGSSKDYTQDNLKHVLAVLEVHKLVRASIEPSGVKAFCDAWSGGKASKDWTQDDMKAILDNLPPKQEG